MEQNFENDTTCAFSHRVKIIEPINVSLAKQVLLKITGLQPPPDKQIYIACHKVAMTDVWCFVVHEGRVWGRTHKDLEWGLFELGVDDNDYLISGYQNIFIKCDFDTLVVYMGEEMHTVARKVVRLHIKHSRKTSISCYQRSLYCPRSAKN